MRRIAILLALLQTLCAGTYSQYVGVRARYSETRLVDDYPNPPRRENRLILSFFEVTPSGVYIPISLTNYDMYVYKEGLQFGSEIGGVLDSLENNYPGYAWTAPKAVAYFNSYHASWIDCDPTATVHYIVNGHELDCGFIGVSYWDWNYSTDMLNEMFTAPNVCLPYYLPPDPYYLAPGNVNFYQTPNGGSMYTAYSFSCYQSTQQYIQRGVIPPDTGSLIVPLPVRFTPLNYSVGPSCRVTLRWSNLTETDIQYYAVERSVEGTAFAPVGEVRSVSNSGGVNNYSYTDTSLLAGYSLFRIKAVEQSGNQFYSPIAGIHGCSGTFVSRLHIYPNPVTSKNFVLQVTNLPKGNYSIMLINANGVQQKITDWAHPGGSASKSISLYKASSGVYQLVIRSAGITLTEKLFITH